MHLFVCFFVMDFVHKTRDHKRKKNTKQTNNLNYGSSLSCVLKIVPTCHVALIPKHIEISHNFQNDGGHLSTFFKSLVRYHTPEKNTIISQYKIQVRFPENLPHLSQTYGLIPA